MKINQGEVVDPKTVGVRLRGPAKWADGTPKKLVWIQLAEVGAFEGHSAGPFELNDEVFSDICRNFEKRGLPIPIDYEHASEQDPTSGSIPRGGAPAQGWVHSLVNRGPAGLWGLTEWLNDARTAIKEGKYSYLSPAIRFESKDPKSGKQIGARLSSVALTNSPFLAGLPGLVAASEKTTTMDLGVADVHAPTAIGSEKKATLSACMSSMRGAMGGHTSPNAECRALHDSCGAMLACLDDYAPNDVAMRDSEGRAARASLLLREAEGKLATQAEELQTLRAEKAAREEREVLEDTQVAFDTYKDTKKLTDGDRALLLSWRRSDPGGFRRMYPLVRPVERHLLRDIVPIEQRPRATSNAAEVDDLARKLMSERGVSWIEAKAQAAQQLRSKAGGP